MGQGNSSNVKRVFEMLDRDHNGVLTLDQIITVQKVPDANLGINDKDWLNSHSPLLLFRFDESQDGAINFQEFSELLKHIKLAQKRSKENRKKKLSSTPTAWKTVGQDTFSQFDLSRDGDTPIITGKRPIVDVPTLEDLEENDLKDLKTEAREFFEKMMKQKEGRDHFMKWLFRLADVDKTETISTEELSLMLNALAKDGIMPESLCFDDGMQEQPSMVAQKIMQEYDTGRTGFLTKEEFMVLADLILRNYELKPDEGSTHVGKYQLKRKIASGSSGIVWMALDTSTNWTTNPGSPVKNSKEDKSDSIPGGKYKAIKIIPKGNVSDMSRVDTEIKAMLMLMHPNIVKLEEVLETNENVFFVMEFCGGGSLSDHVAIEIPSESTALFYFQQLVEGVSYCHSQGVCHRDLKLENLLLDNNGNLKITDFGHAGIFKNGWDIFSTGMVGSLYHLSPEQLEGRCYSGEKIDIWAIGILLYRMLVGEPPFFSTDPYEFVDMVKHARYKLPNHLSDAVKDLISKLLVVDPEERMPLDQIKQHLWFQGDATRPILIKQTLPLGNSSNLTNIWKRLKDICKELQIHTLDAYPNNDDSAVKKIVKCNFPSKELKFTIALLEPHIQEPTLEFNMKDGDSWTFKNTFNKFKQKLTQTSSKESV